MRNDRYPVNAPARLDRELLRRRKPCGTRQKPEAGIMTEMFVGAEYLAQLFHVGKRARKSNAWAFAVSQERFADLREVRQHALARKKRHEERRDRDELNGG